jgi:anti-sigma B factor antagonist
MNIQISSTNEFMVVGVTGRIDTTNAAEFERTVIDLVDKGSKGIVVDCSGLNYISSSGLRVFLVIQKRMNTDNGIFRLSNLQPEIKEIFDISGFSNIFSIFADKSEAVKAGA